MLTDPTLTKTVKQKFLPVTDATVACFTYNRTYFVQGKITLSYTWKLLSYLISRRRVTFFIILRV